MSRKHLWLLPLGLAILLGAAILALPSFVASSTHRGTIEALASSLTGREVRINGRLSLALLPAPQLVAGRVTITGPDQETIQAGSLTLAISLPALLRGQLHATSLTLISPHINLPWPLPGGSAAITPPSWLAALHAQIQNGTVTLGQVHLDNINATIVTGTDSAITVSGNGMMRDQPLALTLALSGTNDTGIAPLRIEAKSGDVAAQFIGALDSAGEVTGQLGLNAPHMTANADLNADATALTATTLQINAGTARLAGSAQLQLLHPDLIATLTGQNIDLSVLNGMTAPWPGLRLDVALNATNVTVLRATFRRVSGGTRRQCRDHFRAPGPSEPGERRPARRQSDARCAWRDQRQREAANPFFARPVEQLRHPGAGRLDQRHAERHALRHPRRARLAGSDRRDRRRPPCHRDADHSRPPCERHARFQPARPDPAAHLVQPPPECGLLGRCGDHRRQSDTRAAAAQQSAAGWHARRRAEYPPCLRPAL